MINVRTVEDLVTSWRTARSLSRIQKDNQIATTEIERRRKSIGRGEVRRPWSLKKTRVLGRIQIQRSPAQGRSGHFMADCKKPKQDTKRQPDCNHRDRKEKKVYRKRRSEKAMVAEENKSPWADTDSEESSSGTSSSCDSDEEVQCLMVDDANEKLSQSFEEVKSEKESRATKVELVGSDEVQAALSKLSTENEELRIRSQEMLNENQRLAEIISSWTKSSTSLQKLQGAMKPFGDKSGLGYGSDERSMAEPSTHPTLDRPKLQTKNFVKSSMGQPEEEKSDESKIAVKPQIWQGRYYGLGYTALENPKESWLRKRVEQIRGQPKSDGRTLIQLSNAFTKERQYMPKYHKPRSQGKHTAYHTHLISQNTHRSQTYLDAYTGRYVKITQVWVP
ncbi:hypothetical protein F511_23380 [Dorcoceras hygrometricum]|uniref:Uncharacterized protein n=1 Tax=Dorcoceras hygrometricum TaxID=472368 RepID=A0A2Z7B7L0_9LAMI|nr:hypothetical protein F511_23380 [Dorcoceras hygrometricum]